MMNKKNNRNTYHEQYSIDKKLYLVPYDGIFYILYLNKIDKSYEYVSDKYGDKYMKEFYS